MFRSSQVRNAMRSIGLGAASTATADDAPAAPPPGGDEDHRATRDGANESDGEDEDEAVLHSMLSYRVPCALIGIKGAPRGGARVLYGRSAGAVTRGGRMERGAPLVAGEATVGREVVVFFTDHKVYFRGRILRCGPATSPPLNGDMERGRGDGAKRKRDEGGDDDDGAKRKRDDVNDDDDGANRERDGGDPEEAGDTAGAYDDGGLGPPPSGGPWTCGACTFQNDATQEDQCEMCTTRRPRARARAAPEHPPDIGASRPRPAAAGAPDDNDGGGATAPSVVGAGSDGAAGGWDGTGEAFLSEVQHEALEADNAQRGERWVLASSRRHVAGRYLVLSMVDEAGAVVRSCKRVLWLVGERQNTTASKPTTTAAPASPAADDEGARKSGARAPAAVVVKSEGGAEDDGYGGDDSGGAGVALPLQHALLAAAPPASVTAISASAAKAARVATAPVALKCGEGEGVGVGEGDDDDDDGDDDGDDDDDARARDGGDAGGYVAGGGAAAATTAAPPLFTVLFDDGCENDDLTLEELYGGLAFLGLECGYLSRQTHSTLTRHVFIPRYHPADAQNDTPCPTAVVRLEATLAFGPARGGGGTAACERALSLSGVTHELVDDVEYPPSYKPRGGTVSKGANAQTPKGESELIVSPKASPSPVEPPSTAVVERGRCAKAIAMRYIRDLHQHLAAHPDAAEEPPPPPPSPLAVTQHSEDLTAHPSAAEPPPPPPAATQHLEDEIDPDEI